MRTYFLFFLILTFFSSISVASPSVQSSKINAIQEEISDSLDNIGNLVNNHYIESWWTPSKEKVLVKIQSVFDDKNILDYDIEDIKKFPGKIKQIKMVLGEDCYAEFDKLQERIQISVNQLIERNI